MTDLAHLSEHELTDMIARATKALEQSRQQARRATIAQMKALAASIDVDVVIKDQPREVGRLKGSKVPVKYRDPADSNNAWSGRGVKPRWLQRYLDQGRSIDEFRV